jgi:hypothetical protein
LPGDHYASTQERANGHGQGACDEQQRRSPPPANFNSPTGPRLRDDFRNYKDNDKELFPSRGGRPIETERREEMWGFEFEYRHRERSYPTDGGQIRAPISPELRGTKRALEMRADSRDAGLRDDLPGSGDNDREWSRLTDSRPREAFIGLIDHEMRGYEDRAGPRDHFDSQLSILIDEYGAAPSDPRHSSQQSSNIDRYAVHHSDWHDGSTSPMNIDNYGTNRLSFRRASRLQSTSHGDNSGSKNHRALHLTPEGVVRIMNLSYCNWRCFNRGLRRADNCLFLLSCVYS